MIFGNPLSFAVEAIVEPGPEFPPTFGRNVAGRMRLFVGGASVGDILEPCCVPRALSDHLLELCGFVDKLWHPLLAGATPEEQFRLLDSALFLGGGNPDLEECYEMSFITNVDEAFDPIKGFALSPSPDEIILLVRLDEGSPLIHCAIPFVEFSGVATSFAHWLAEQEGALLNGSAV